jgi:DNA-binding NarL/FixJ family response regulator
MNRTLIIADHALAAEAIRRELRHGGGCSVIGYVDGRRPCGLAVAQAAPDVVVIDEMRDGAMMLERIPEARAAVPAAKLVLVTANLDRALLRQAAAAGIDAAIAKTVHPGSLGVFLREMLRGSIFHAFPPTWDQPAAGLGDAGLTARELEILRLIVAGRSNARIAGGLHVAEGTIKFHLSNVYRKLNVSNRTEASRWAQLHGLLPVAGLQTTAA